MKISRFSISRESIAIAMIGIADLATTLMWVHQHGAREANPVFAHYLAMGPVWFSLMKLVCLAAPIFLLEWARRRRPKFTLWASRFAITAYVMLYGIGFVRLNGALLRPHEAGAAVVASQRGMTDEQFEQYARNYVPGTIRSRLQWQAAHHVSMPAL